MELLTLRTLLTHLYEETGKPVFVKPHKNNRCGFPSFPDMINRQILPKCGELKHIQRGRPQMNILDQKNVLYRDSVLKQSEKPPDYYGEYLNACKAWLQEEEYDANALRSRLIPWLKRYIPDGILLPVTPSLKLYEAISSLLQPELPLQAHGEALMWLMLYAALGNDLQKLCSASPFSSLLAQDLLLSRAEEIDKISTFLMRPENQGQIAVLFAGGGIGKTYLASQILQRLQQKGFCCHYYLGTKELEEAFGLLCKTPEEPKNIIFIDDAPLGFENEPVFQKLSFRNNRILVTTRCEPKESNARLVLFPVSPFSADHLSRYFLSKTGDSVSQERKDKMYSSVKQIAEKIDCNTDLFLSLSRLMCRHVFEPEELLEKLNLLQAQSILVNGMPLCKYIYQLFFSHDFVNVGDSQAQYLFRMAFLPKSGISREQLNTLMKDIDPQDMIRQELLAYGFLKAVSFTKPELRAYVNDQSGYSIHDNMRQAAVLSFADRINDPEFADNIRFFLRTLKDQLCNCKQMCNKTTEEDQKRYLNLLFWQKAAQFLTAEESTLHLLKLLADKDKELISQLLYAVSDLFYFCSIYDDALSALDRAKEIAGSEDEDFQKLRLTIASVTGKEDAGSANCKEKGLSLWECLRGDRLWQPSCQVEEKKSVLTELQFTDLRTDEVSLCAETLRKKAEELTRNGWMVLRIQEEENGIKLYSLRTQDMQMRRIMLGSDEDKIIELFQNTYILPKTSWKATPQEMLREGLKRKRYDGWGIFRKCDEKLLSYVDVKILSPVEPGPAQIGFAATDVSARSKRLTQFLINRICLEYPTQGTFFTTHKQNGSMRRAAGELGYQECQGVEYNRIVEDIATLRYEKGPLVKKKP